MSNGKHLIQVGLVFSGAAAMSCTLMLSRDETLQGPDAAAANGGQAGAEPTGAGGMDSDGLDAGDAGSDVSETGSSEPPDATPEAEPPGMNGRTVADVLRLAFVEDPDEDYARLQLVDVSAALFSTNPPEVWRRSLRVRSPALDALDFAWSPDGRYLALRYQSLDGPRLAFFAAPGWTELPLQELAESASQPVFYPTANYVWSPGSSLLAVELATSEGPFVGAFRVDPTGTTTLEPVAFSTAPESMSWASPSRLFVLHNPAGGREIIVLESNGGALSQERLVTDPIAAPIGLRPASPGGVLGASETFLHFWTPAGEGVSHDARAYLSSGSSFVAAPGDLPELETLEPIGGSNQPLATLTNCSTVLTWIEGPEPGSLAGSKLACHALVDGAATITIHAFDQSEIRTAFTLDDDRIRSAFAVEADWATHARSFSVRGEWLALTTATSDAFIDLRGPGDPLYYIRDVADAGATSRAFSPSGAHVLVQRGQQLFWLVLGTSAEQPPDAWPLQNTALEAAPCSTTRNAANWCGAPRAGELTGPRWATTDDIAALLSQEEGLVLAALASNGGSLSIPVSTCGAGCVRGFAFSR